MTFHIRHKIITLFFISCFICFPKFVQAESNVLINEFLVDPQPQQVELYNKNSNAVDISGWFLDDSGGSTYFTIPSGTMLNGQSCVVFSGDFSLNKTSADTMRLFDSTANPVSSNANLIDSYNYPKSSGSGISFMRMTDGSTNWATGSATIGKFNQSNENCITTPSSSPTVTPPSPSPEPTAVNSTIPTLLPTSQPIHNIIITEVMAYPDTSDNEWVELYNNNNFSVTFANWYIDDVENSGSTPKIFSMEIVAHGYSIVNINTSMFNNDGDTVRVLNSYKNEVDSIEYGTSEKGKSLGRVSLENDTFCEQNPSPGHSNNSCISAPTTQSTHTINPTVSPLPSPTIEQTDTLNLISDTPSPKKLDSSFLNNSENNSNTFTQPLSEKGQVMGTQTRNDPKRTAIIQSLSYISVVFSLLGIISVLVKIKNMA